jgi:hypothetical protein
MDILTTHPSVIHRRRVFHNPYYISPIVVLKEKLFGAPTIPIPVVQAPPV